MQDDWAKWLPICEFGDNNKISSATSLSPFFCNKGFHPRMSFSPESTSYETTRERIEAAKAEDIAQKIHELLEYAQGKMRKSQEIMKRQADKYRKDVSYNIGDRVWLSSKNIPTTRPSKSLEDKALGPYPIIEKVGNAYKLDLPHSIRKLHPVFSPAYLRRDPNNPLLGQ